MKKVLIALVLVMFIPISVKADTSFGIDATWANWEEKNDCVWVVVYKVPYAQILPSDYNGTIKYDSSAFSYNDSDLSQYAGEVAIPCDGCKSLNNEESGEVTLSVNKEVTYPITSSSAPKNIRVVFHKKPNFDNTKQYEFSYNPDKYGEVKIIVEFDENGRVEVVSATGPRFDFANAQMEDGSKEYDKSKSKNGDVKETSDRVKKENINLGESNSNSSDDGTVETSKKAKNNIFLYICVGSVIAALVIGTGIVIKKKKKEVE